ncbi:MAG: MarR family winged helix-turn-helix transcriptional regulator [Paracoccaceae bacterium]|nr:MarR family winged helix-turn-helix transcriptional regulator [Paracoccaceae bacterium]
MTEFRLNEFLPWQLAELADQVSRGFAALYRPRFGISVAEWRVVAHLSQADRVGVREIHERVRMGKWQVSRAARRLEERGYVRKRAGRRDRRLVELSLTRKGRAMLDEILPLAFRYEKDVLALAGDGRDFQQSIRLLLETLDRADRSDTGRQVRDASLENNREAGNHRNPGTPRNTGTEDNGDHPL